MWDTLTSVSTKSLRLRFTGYLPVFHFQPPNRYSSVVRSSTRVCCANFVASLFSRFLSVSTIFAVIWVNEWSCFGSSSERVIRRSSVPV